MTHTAREASGRLLTYEDYAALPDDGKRYELLEGRLVVVPSPLTIHQGGSGNIFFVLKAHADARNLGKVFAAPLDVILDEHDTVQPDVIFVSRERAGRITRRGIEGAPDLVVEILSESTASRDCIEKRELYERAGVLEYWIASPEEVSIAVLVLDGGVFHPFSKAIGPQRVKSRLFPDLEVVPDLIFAPPCGA